MEIIEIRELDGPNVFTLQPAIKLEVALTGQVSETEAISRLCRSFQFAPPTAELLSQPIPLAVEAVREAVLAAHRIASMAGPEPTAMCVPLETPGHFAIVYGWDHRRIARLIAECIGEVLEGSGLDSTLLETRLQEALGGTGDADDQPSLIRDADRNVFTIAVTGTNGKTTTTRLLAHIFRHSGVNVGWSSSSGVYINGECVVAGDYSGPSGARRVLTDPSVEVGVVEAARGGILLRGLAFESNDVSVFTNVSDDHLGLQGVRSVQALADVKSVVCKVTRPDGFAIVNADDPLVLKATEGITARRLFFSRGPAFPIVEEHVQKGGGAIVSEAGRIQILGREGATEVATLANVPLTFKGRAGFMVENVLAATGAAHVAGLSVEQIRDGICSFQSDTGHNPGRLNLFNVNGVLVVIDYAHNESGLFALIAFARTLMSNSGRLITIVGTAGDRKDESLIALGRIAAEQSDYVIAKGTQRYLRGRQFDELLQLYIAGIESVRGAEYEQSENEFAAVRRAVEIARPGDVVAVMAQEDPVPIFEYLRLAGGWELPAVDD